MSRHHCIDYFELPATDLAAAKRFYSAAFDWRFTDYGPTMLALDTLAPTAKLEAYPTTQITLAIPWRFSTATTLKQVSRECN
jgi:hypothetical protein